MTSPLPGAGVGRLISELTALIGSNPSRDDLRIQAHMRLSAFIGRAALRDGGYTPPDEIAPVLQEARDAVQRLAVAGPAGFVRMELLSELDKAIATVRHPGG